MPKAEITIKVRARDELVPVRSFLTIVDSALSILKELQHSKHYASAEWKISAASLQSPLTFTIGSDDPNGQELVREYLGVFKEAEKSEKFPPDRWTQKTLEGAKRVVSVLNDGVAQITFTSAGIETISPTQRVAATVDYLLAPAYEDYGSFEGRLETLSVHGRTRFNIFDPITGRPVSCYFKEGQLEKAHSAFNHRVLITGTVKYSRIGQPVSVIVDDIRVLVGGVKLDDLREIDITGGIESAMYVRRLRDAQR
jgi:hypothetical protein